MHVGANEPQDAVSPSRMIDGRIEELGDWRGEMLSRVRGLIKEADPDVVEEWKWRGVPVWYHDGMVCTGETYKSAVKLTFAKGASLEDPLGLFNSSLEGSTRRAIDILEGRVPRERVAGKLVLVGTSALGLLDTKTTPVDRTLPGVEVHAQILESALTRTTLTAPVWTSLAELAAMLVIGLGLICSKIAK